MMTDADAAAVLAERAEWISVTLERHHDRRRGHLKRERKALRQAVAALVASEDRGQVRAKAQSQVVQNARVHEQRVATGQVARLFVDVAPDVHARLADLATAEGSSIGALVARILGDAVGVETEGRAA